MKVLLLAMELTLGWARLETHDGGADVSFVKWMVGDVHAFAALAGQQDWVSRMVVQSADRGGSSTCCIRTGLKI